MYFTELQLHHKNTASHEQKRFYFTKGNSQNKNAEKTTLHITEFYLVFGDFTMEFQALKSAALPRKSALFRCGQCHSSYLN